MNTLKPGRYIVLLPDNSLNMKLAAVQTELFRNAGTVQARLLPPCAPLFPLNDTDFPGEKPPSAAFGKKIAGEMREIVREPIGYGPPELFGGNLLALPLRSEALSRRDDALFPAIILAPFSDIEEYRNEAETALGICRSALPGSGTMTRGRPGLLHILRLDDRESRWELYPL